MPRIRLMDDTMNQARQTSVKAVTVGELRAEKGYENHEIIVNGAASSADNECEIREGDKVFAISSAKTGGR